MEEDIVSKIKEMEIKIAELEKKLEQIVMKNGLKPWNYFPGKLHIGGKG